MSNPIWIEVCSCGKPTGNVTIAQREPAASVPRRGHSRHTVHVVKLCDDGSKMTEEQRERLRDVDRAFVVWAINGRA